MAKISLSTKPYKVRWIPADFYKCTHCGVGAVLKGAPTCPNCGEPIEWVE